MLNTPQTTLLLCIESIHVEDSSHYLGEWVTPSEITYMIGPF